MSSQTPPPPVNFSNRRLFDRLGREIEPGDGIHIFNKSDVIWRVKSIESVLRPDLPAGTVEVFLVAAMRTGVPGGVRIPDVIKVIDHKDQQMAEAATGVLP